MTGPECTAELVGDHSDFHGRERTAEQHRRAAADPAAGRDFRVTLVFDVGDYETVARFDMPRVQAPDPVAAAAEVLDRFDAGKAGGGFTRDDVVQVIVTRAEPGVAPNLLPAGTP